ncbi:MAG TPA: sulfotransferase [Blastocatellia bacterium]
MDDSKGGDNRIIVCVLGMHRSGTSLVAGIVNALGVFMGREERLTPKKIDNPAGFWELASIWPINDQILVSMEGTWRRPPVLKSGWELSPALSPLLEKARRLVTEEFGNHRIWGWKDPRTCLTLPFWRRVVAPSHFIICLRNPIDVWNSLALRGDGFPLDKISGLWCQYVSSAFANTVGGQRLFVWYEDLMADHARQIERIGEFLGEAFLNLESRQKAEQLIERPLSHYSTTPQEVAAFPGLPSIAADFYALIREHSSEEGWDGGQTPALQELLKRLTTYCDDARDAEGAARSGPDEPNHLQVFWDGGTGFSESASAMAYIISDGKPHRYLLQLGTEFHGPLRIDPGWIPSYWKIRHIKVYDGLDDLKHNRVSATCSAETDFEGLSPVRSVDFVACGETYDFTTSGIDPQMLLEVPARDSSSSILEVEVSCEELRARE